MGVTESKAPIPVVWTPLLGVIVVTMLLAACASNEEATGASSPSPTAVKRNTPYPTVVSAVGECDVAPGAECPGADMRGVDLSEIMYDYTNVGRPGGVLKGANLRGADFTGAKLHGVEFTAADLRDAIMRDADLSSTYLYQADLRGADLTRAKFLHVDMDETKLDGAIFCETLMPDGTIRNDYCP